MIFAFDSIKNQASKYNKKNLNLKISRKTDSISLEDVFISRDSIQKELDNFFKSPQIMFILIGKSGFGKTTFLTKAALDFEAKEDVCLFIPLRILPKDIIYTQPGDKGFFKRLLSIYFGTLEIDLPLLALELEQRNRFIYIILDGINEFLPNDFSNCEELYKKIYFTACEIDALNISRIKFIISSRNETWYQLQACHSGFQNENIFYNNAQPIIINQFTEDEFKQAYEKYRSVYQIKTEFEKLVPLTIDRLMDPFMLNLTCETKKGGQITIEAPSIDIYNQFFKIKFEKLYPSIDVPYKFLIEFAKICFHHEKNILELSELPTRSDNNLLKFLIDLNIIIKSTSEDEKQIHYIHDRFFEFFLGEVLKDESINSEEDILRLLNSKKSFFHLLYGALKFFLLSKNDAGFFCLLVNSKNNDVESLCKDVLFEISQSKPEFFKAIYDRYTKTISNTTLDGMRVFLQAMSLNKNMKELIFDIMDKSNDPTVQAEANFYFVSLCLSEINQHGFILSKSNLIRALCLDRTKSGWFKVIIILSVLTRLSWDNFEGDRGKYFHLMAELLKGAITDVASSDIAEISKKLETEEFTKKYFFSAKNIKDFFKKSKGETSDLQKSIDLLRDYQNIPFCAILPYLIKGIPYKRKITRMIFKILLIFLYRKYPDEIKSFLLKNLKASKNAKEGNTLSALAAYTNLANGDIDLKFISDMNEFFLLERNGMLEYETDYERLFNPIGTYGFIYPIKNKSKEIDLFSKYMKEFIKNNENKLLLRVLHALRQSISLFPKEGLETLQPFLNYNKDADVRERLIWVLAESYARNPEITNIFLNKYGGYFSKEEQYQVKYGGYFSKEEQHQVKYGGYFSKEEQHQVKFGIDHKIYAHSITILEWCRVYNFLFSRENSHIHVHQILTIINNAGSIEESLEKIVEYFKKSD